MVGEGDLRMMYSEESLRMQQADFLTEFGGYRMYLAPLFVVLTILHNGKVDDRKQLAYTLVMIAEAAIARVEDIVSFLFQ